MSQVTLSSPIPFFVPFEPVSRAADERRIVRGKCYTSGRVPGDKWNLTREAMEEAAPRYMEMPCIRSMHQPIASGKALSVVFDENGHCVIEAEIFDDNEWNKVVNGVYRGFSVYAKPTLVRSVDVIRCDWVETSLVDRPKDSGALFSFGRAEDADGEYEVEVLESDEDIERYDPSQPRDDKGRFSSGGGGGGSKGSGSGKKDDKKDDGKGSKKPKAKEAKAKLDAARAKMQKARAVHNGNVKGGVSGEELAKSLTNYKGALDQLGEAQKQYRAARKFAQGAVSGEDVQRGITADVMPVRENLEGPKRADEDDIDDLIDELHEQLLETDDGPDTHPLIRKAVGAAQTVLNGTVERGILREDYAWLLPATSPTTFKDQSGATLNDILCEAFRTAQYRFFDEVMNAPDLETRHRNVNDYAGFLHAYLDHDNALRAQLATASARGEIQGEAETFTALIERLKDNTDSALVARAETAESQAHSIESEKQNLESEVSIVRADLESAQSTVQRLEGELSGATGNILRLEGEVTRLEGEASGLQNQIKNLREAPIPRQAALYSAESLGREFSVNQLLVTEQQQKEVKRAELIQERDKLFERLQREPDSSKRSEGSVRLMTLQQDIARLA